MSIECTYCEEKVNAKRGIYIKCTRCQDVKLCLECFSAGVIIAQHDSDHPYQIIDCGSFPIIDDNWKAHEELALLEAIELYGLGSWTDIANAVETRTADECRERYLNVYVENFFGRSTWNAIDKSVYSVQDHTCLHNQPLSPSLSLPKKHKIVDINRDQQIRLGYMPKRDDFEREYDNEAELLVSKLAVHANDDTDLDQDLKIAHINMYTDKLRERFRRKRVVLEYNLVKLFFHMHPEENSDLNNEQPTATGNLLDSTSNNDQLNLLPQRQQQLLKQSMLNETALNHTTTKTSSSSTNDMTQSPHDCPDVKPFILGQTHDFKPLASTTTSSTSSLTISAHPSHQAIQSSSQTANGKISPTKVQNTILNYFQRLDPTAMAGTNEHHSGQQVESEVVAVPGKNSASKTKSNNSNTIVATNTTNTISTNASRNSETSENPHTSILSSYFSDLNKSIAEHEFNSMEKRLRIFCQFSSVEEHNQLISNLAREKELKFKIKELMKKRRNGIKYHHSSSLSGVDQESSTKTPSTKKTKVSSNQSRNTDEPMDVDNNSITQSPTKVTQKKNNNCTSNGSSNNKSESTKAIMNLDFNQNPEPSGRLLSDSEKRLCKSYNLKPSQYISQKTVILNEHDQKRKKKKGAAQNLFTDAIDKDTKRKLVDFFIRNGWIKGSKSLDK